MVSHRSASLIDPVREIDQDQDHGRDAAGVRPGLDAPFLTDDVGLLRDRADARRYKTRGETGTARDVRDRTTSDPWGFLDRADVDVLVMPANLLPPEHPQEVLFEDDFVCIAWTGNDAVGETLALEQYLDLGHVTCQFNRGRTPMADEWFLQHHGHSRRIEVITTTFNAVPLHVVNTRDRHDPRPLETLRGILPIRLLKSPVAFPVVIEAVQWHKLFDATPASPGCGNC